MTPARVVELFEQLMTAPVQPKLPAPPVIISGIQTCISTDMRDADDWPGCKD